MSQAAKALEQDRKARARLRLLRHHEQVIRNVSQTWFFGISRTLFYSPWDRGDSRRGTSGVRDTGIRGHLWFEEYPTSVGIISLISVKRRPPAGPGPSVEFLPNNDNNFS
jgi:hypothetical protein